VISSSAPPGLSFVSGNCTCTDYLETSSPAGSGEDSSTLRGTSGNRPGHALKLAGVRPSRARGQNFLVQPSIAAQVASAAQIEVKDDVVEIGPGLGILTEQILAASPRRLTLVELDSRLAAMLIERFGHDTRVKILSRDFMTMDLSELGDGRLKVLGNLPFNIAAAILRKLSDCNLKIARMVLMFQREVGERIRAQPGSRNYGALSVFTGLHWHIIGHFRVAAGSFHPRPRVDAEVLFMEPRDREFTNAEQPDVRTTIRAAFSTPRKTIRNSLAGGLQMDHAVIEAALEAVKIDPSLRPAMLDPLKLIALARILRPVTSLLSRA
jgi:16S rRNA (adenine1518-N6/adenine1519-N6)-dimethyltransferase